MAKKVGKLNPIAEGWDSVVHSLTRPDNSDPSSVVKLYSESNFQTINPKDRRKVLEEYYTDTLKAMSILEKNPNPLSQSIQINGRKFSLKYKIIPQGKVLLEEAGEDRGAIDNKVLALKASFGQKFVAGLNLSYIRRHVGIDDDDFDKRQSFISGDSLLCSEIEDEAKRLFEYLSRELGVSFGFANVNIKPFLEEESGELLIVITDLAASLFKYYDESPKFNSTDSI